MDKQPWRLRRVVNPPSYQHRGSACIHRSSTVVPPRPRQELAIGQFNLGVMYKDGKGALTLSALKPGGVVQKK